MSTPLPNGPVYELKAGPLKLTTWANEREDGSINYVSYLTRRYRLAAEKRNGEDDDGWRTTYALREGDLLLAAEMQRLARLRIGVLELINRVNPSEGER